VHVSCTLEDAVAVDGEAPREVAIHVDDAGPGVPDHVRDRIFEPFFTTKASGSGLGLSIVHAIVTQHGGSVTVDEAPDGGARFTLRLPRAIEARSAAV
jgi:signal transduction histidine kinase